VVSGAKYGKGVVLGAAGFIGISLANVLDAEGFEVVCFDRFVSPHWPKTARTIVGDFTGIPVELLRELDNALVFHLVSSCRPSASTALAADEVNRDLVTTVRYLEETKSRGLRWIFLSSGGTVYGQNEDDQIAESSRTNPICSYGAVKLAIEHYFALYGRLYGLDYVVVRPANPYGPWQYPLTGQGIIAALVYKALRKDTVEIWGDGTNVRDYIFITDAVGGILAAATSGKTSEIYNVATGVGWSINQVVDIVSEILKRQVSVKYSEARHIDVKRNVLCVNKISSHTGWMPRMTMQQGIALTAEWLKQHVEV
jgi:UDP-glucose 4-epimerase